MPELNAAICTGFQTQAQDQAQEQRFQALEQRLERDAAQRQRENAERGREAAERGREAKAMAAQLNEIGRQLRELRDTQRRVPPELFLAHTGPDGLPRFTTYPQVRPLVTYSQSINQPVITPGAPRPTIGPHV